MERPKEQTLAYRAGIKAAEAGTNINNSYPFTSKEDFSNWRDGYRSVKPKTDIDWDLYELDQALKNGRL